MSKRVARPAVSLWPVGQTSSIVPGRSCKAPSYPSNCGEQHRAALCRAQTPSCSSAGEMEQPCSHVPVFLVTGQKHKGPRDCLYCLRLLTPKQILHRFSFINSFMLQCQRVNSVSGEKHKCLQCLLKSWCRAQIEVDDCQRHLGAPPASAPKSSSGANENCSIQVTANRARARNLTLKKD